MDSSAFVGGFDQSAPGVLAAVTCVVDDLIWETLCGLDDTVLFHADLFAVLGQLPSLIVGPDLRDAITDLVLNGSGFD
ncbi:hypothetical protein DSM112329_05064 [Paraconexibacter sp. AEG42_29]|uniref:Uncharacterized protein n=1 Tax=Paraconexibacter sp. AEG42_29 TaxID=2997339 RepID=A0AAU7B3I3_9ACTN